MSAYGKILPRYYDTYMGNEDEIILPLKKLLKKYKPQGPHVLELACGTGTILASLPKKYHISGLDLSEEMLKQAKKKLPYATFYHANMTNFALPASYNLILCMFDAINHLHTFPEWEKTFRLVEKHLAPKGYFIFDINTLERFSIAVNFPAFAREIGKDVIIFKSRKTSKAPLFDAHFKFFIHNQNSTYKLFEEHVYEAGFPTARIIKTLSKYFIIEEQFTMQSKKPSHWPQRLFFVCKKR